MSPFTALITGLTTGGLTCFAVQGGLLVGLLARRNDGDEELRGWRRLFLPVSAFLVAKIIAYTVLGLGLGWLGDRLTISSGMKITLQVVAGLFMVVAGIRLIAPHWLPWLTIAPPAAVRRFIRQRAKSQALIAPAILGFLTILIPCGTTQAMELAAISTGSAWQGAAILLAFTLGTVPLFFIIGVLAKETSFFQRRLKYAAAALVVGLGLYSFNGALVASGSSYSFQNVMAGARLAFGGESAGAEDNAAATNLVISVLPTGYDPNELTVPAGQPVTISLNAQGRLGCTSIFRLPQLNLETAVAQDRPTTIAATFPKPGRYTFTCGMGMFSGTINAV
ncbi:MAG: sulfite exporter TauE/SafE family protein [Candidatus Kerfeldbacteria bacterium]|nr:sulfite exporter TauE/SafE family protein [Candidatus Kerfeldbacteria bacterium]